MLIQFQTIGAFGVVLALVITVMGIIFKRQSEKIMELIDRDKSLETKHDLTSRELEKKIETEIARVEAAADARASIYTRLESCNLRHQNISSELSRGNELFERVLSEIQAQSTLTVKNDTRLDGIADQMKTVNDNIRILMDHAFNSKAGKGG